LYRGIRDPKPAIRLEELMAAVESVAPVVWWSFSSTTTVERTARWFLEGGQQRLLYKVAGRGSQARDVQRYSAIPTEHELLMPCGTAFVLQKVEEASHGLVSVSMQQTEAVLLQRAGSVADDHQHPGAPPLPYLALTSASSVSCAVGTMPVSCHSDWGRVRAGCSFGQAGRGAGCHGHGRGLCWPALRVSSAIATRAARRRA
jgi:hypothetical protein